MQWCHAPWHAIATVLSTRYTALSNNLTLHRNHHAKQSQSLCNWMDALQQPWWWLTAPFPRCTHPYRQLVAAPSVNIASNLTSITKSMLTSMQSSRLFVATCMKVFSTCTPIILPLMTTGVTPSPTPIHHSNMTAKNQKYSTKRPWNDWSAYLTIPPAPIICCLSSYQGPEHAWPSKLSYPGQHGAHDPDCPNPCLEVGACALLATQSPPIIPATPLLWK